MIQLNFEDIISTELQDSFNKESLALSPTESFEEIYWAYRYFYVTLMNIFSTDLRVSQRNIIITKNALDQIGANTAVDSFLFLKSEIVLSTICQKTSYSCEEIEKISTRIDTDFRKTSSLTELLLIYHDFENFVTRVHTRETRTSWINEFHTPLFTLYHMYRREKEIFSGIDRLPFVSVEERSLRVSEELSRYKTKHIRKHKFPTLLQYSNAPLFCASWMENLEVFFSHSCQQNMINAAHSTKKIQMKSETYFFISRKHKRLVEGFCSLLLRCAGSQVIESQLDFFSMFQNTLGSQISSASFISTDHELQTNSSFPSPLPRVFQVDWAQRRLSQLLFLLRCESVNHMDYRKNIILSELPAGLKGIIAPQNEVESQCFGRQADWISNQKEINWNVQEETKARKMLHDYHLNDRMIYSHAFIESQSLTGSWRKQLSMIDTNEIQAAKRSFGLYL